MIRAVLKSMRDSGKHHRYLGGVLVVAGASLTSLKKSSGDSVRASGDAFATGSDVRAHFFA